MTNSNTHTASCLCGKVKATFTPAESAYGACHCGMCRKWTGGPSLAIDCGTTVTIEKESETSIGIYNSSKWAERGFCKNCGSSLFYRLKEKSHYYLNMGFADDISGFIFDHQVFIDDKPESYTFANETKNLTGPEVFAAFQG